MKFFGLYEGERTWLGSRQILYAMDRLGIDHSLYELPSPYILNAEELHYYVQSILNELRGKPNNEYYDYVMQRCEALKRWADKGYIVHVL